MEPIRVLNLFTIMNRGGAETMVMNYYRNIDRTKVQFDFLVHREERGAYEDEIEALGGRIYRMIPLYPQNFSRYKKMIRSFLKEHQEYKVIHSHMSELGYFVFKEAKRQQIPVRICHAHSAPYEWDFKMLVREYFKWRIRFYTTHMFTCSDAAAKWLFGLENREHFIQLNNAIETEKFIYSPQIEQQVRKELKLEDKYIVGHIGNFTYPKNQMFLVDIFYEIQKQKENAALVLVGDGKFQQKVKDKVKKMKIENKVLFLGSRTDVNRILQCFNAFLFPSIFEGLPVSVIEAQASGNMCVVSNAVPEQCCISSHIKRVSLEKKASEWAEIALQKTVGFKKENMQQEIIETGFDIKKNAKWLEEFYLNVTK